MCLINLSSVLVRMSEIIVVECSGGSCSRKESTVFSSSNLLMYYCSILLMLGWLLVCVCLPPCMLV